VRLRNRKFREFDGYADDEDIVFEDLIDEDVSFDDDAAEALFEDELLEDLEFDESLDFEDDLEDGAQSWYDDVVTVADAVDDEFVDELYDVDFDVSPRARRSWFSAVRRWSRSSRPARSGRPSRRRSGSTIATETEATVIRPDFVTFPGAATQTEPAAVGPCRHCARL
jgi:hypothetical protein